MNGNGSMIGGDGTLGTTGGKGTTSCGTDDDGWINGRIIGGGPTGFDGAMAGADDGGSGITVVGSPAPPEGPGPGMNMGDGDLLLIVFLRPLRRVRSPSRNV